MNDPSVLALGATVLQSNINSAAAQAAGIRLPYPGFTGNVAQALRKYPQYQNIAWRGVPVGESKYHAVETVLERRFSRGLQARVAYTFSKLHNNGSEKPRGATGRTPQFRIRRTRSSGPSVRTIRRMCSWSASPGKCLAPRGGPRVSQRLSLRAGTSVACSDTRAGGRST